MGFFTTIALVSVLGLAALRPPMPRHSTPWNIQFSLGFLINEQPFLGLYWLTAGTVPALATHSVDMRLWWLVTVPLALLIALAVRSCSARRVLTAALLRGLGDHCPQAALLRRSRIPLLRVLFLPFASYRPDVRRFRNIRYGDAWRGHLLDVYASRRRPHRAPVLIYLHAGGLRMGTKMLGARPLLYRLASRGWVCVSANYRMHASYREQLTDVKRVIAWIREHGAAYGADSSAVILMGSSSGAHLAATAALTADDARFQPGFETVDTSTSGVVALYGYFGSVGGGENVATSPVAFVHGDAPPFFIIHGTLDTLVLVEDARHFADELARVSDKTVVYAELPGTQHNFDLFHSVRCHAVTDAVESFVTCIHARVP